MNVRPKTMGRIPEIQPMGSEDKKKYKKKGGGQKWNPWFEEKKWWADEHKKLWK